MVACTSIALRYGNHKYYGLQLRNFELESLIRKIQKIQLLLIKPDTSKLVTTILAWYQHITGFSSPILEKYSRNVNYINSCWINDLVCILQKYGAEIN